MISPIETVKSSTLSEMSLNLGTAFNFIAYFQKHDKPKFVTCLAFAENGDLLTGDSNGTLLVWARGMRFRKTLDNVGTLMVLVRCQISSTRNG